ncbi:hypothetical protein LTS08_007654 [Lithohypha guttulata]|nr:hypothetical protein LTS08_007654 [Lithohypha guttulata]
MSASPIRLAVLDDYAYTSKPIFEHFTRQNPDHNVQIDYCPSTLLTRTPDGLKAAIDRLKPYTIISTMRERTPFPAELISQLPNLKLLLTTGSRNASIDLAECVARRIAELDLRVKTGRGEEGWQEGLNTGLAGKTLGLLGLGRLGVQAAATGILGFGMKVLAWSENLTQEKADRAAADRGLPAGSFRVASSKQELFANADVLSVHYVLSDRSRGTVGKQELSWMKKSSVLINTSRGPLIDESALVNALRQKKLKGVGLDVFDVEPLPEDSVWRSNDWPEDVTVLVSPHMGYVEENTMTSWYEQTADNVGRWLRGEELFKQMSTTA